MTSSIARPSRDDRRFDDALALLWMAFQPIVSYPNRRIHAYEGLVRSEEPTLAGPLQLIAAARKLGRSQDLGRSIRHRIATTLRELPADVLLFINVDGTDLEDAALLDSRNPLLPHAHRLVLEITERATVQSVRWLPVKLELLRDVGFRVAVDDVTAGRRTLPWMERVVPDYVKLDLSLVRGIDRDPAQREQVYAMARGYQDRGSQVIAEGVEHEAERDVLLGLGCELHQGFLFGKPSRICSASG
jgi:EAL domain-containing protein (putative c-di-GMP-specific phosphodiesterase class I)